MTNSRNLSKQPSKVLFILSLTFLLLASVSCESRESKAKKSVQEYLKNQGVRELQVAMFHPSKDNPGKAYVAVDVTYNFATGEGKFKREFLGYILRQEGQGWVVEKSAGYTKDQSRAEDYIAGRK